MMLLPMFVISLFAGLSVLGYIKSRSLLSPLLLVPLLWSLHLVAYYLIPHDLFELQPQFLISIALWVSAFFVGALIVDSTPAEKISLSGMRASSTVRKFYLILSLIMAPLAAIMLWKEAVAGPTPNIFINLRVINIGEGDASFSLGALNYVFNIAFIALLIELVESDSNRLFTPRVWTLLALNLVLAMLTVGKLLFLNLLVAIIVVLAFKGRLRKAHFFTVGIVTLGLFLLITLLRSSDEGQLLSELISENIKVYALSSLPAFDTLQVERDGWFGANVFRFFYAVWNAAGGNVPVENTIYAYAEVPYLTNVYTVMYIFFVDFGYKGVAIGGLLFGLFYQVVYKFSLGESRAMLVYFAILFPTLLTQFTGEFILTNFSNTLQFLILIFVPYVIGKAK